MRKVLLISSIALIAISVTSLSAFANVEQSVSKSNTTSHKFHAQITSLVEYETCIPDSAWIRPTVAQQAEKFRQLPQLRRLGFKQSRYWRNNIFLISRYGLADIGNVITQSGLWTNQEEIFNCYKSYNVKRINSKEEAVVWLLGHTVVSMNWQNNQYVMVVKPAQRGVQLVKFNRIDNLNLAPLNIKLQNRQKSVFLDGGTNETANLP
jgi:hypothetical protein